MIPIRLQLEGFTSYRDKVEVDFTGFDLACISGQNGAGKSSLLDAITYALYGKARGKSDAIINTASNAATVSLDFEYEDQTYRVLRRNPRGKSTEVFFYILNPEADSPEKSWKDLSEHSVRETDAKIQKTLRLDYDSFVNASFFLQGKADSFATKSPTERKVILSSILGLDQWEQYAKAAKDKKAEIKGRVEAIEQQIESIQNELAGEENSKQELASAQMALDLVKEKIKAQEAQLAVLRAEAQAINAQAQKVELLKKQVLTNESALLKKQAQAADKRAKIEEFEHTLAKAEEITAAYQKLQSSRKEMESLDLLSQQVSPLENKRGQLETELRVFSQRLNSEIENLKKEEKALQMDLEKSNEDRLKLKGLTEQIDALGEPIEPESLNEEISQLEEEFNKLNQENGGLKAQSDELVERLNKVNNVNEAVCPTCGQDLSPEHREQVVAEIKALGKPLGDQYRENKEVIEALKGKLSALKSKQNELRATNQKRNRLENEAALLKQSLQQLEVREKQWKAEKAVHLQTIQAELIQESFLPEVRLELTELQQKIAVLAYDQNLHNEVRKRIQSLAGAEKAQTDLLLAQNNSSLIKAELENLQAEIQGEQDSLEDAREGLNKEVEALNEARLKTPDPRIAQIELDQLREDQAVSDRKIGELNQALASIQKQRERQTTLREEKERLNEQIRQYAKLETAFGKSGVPAMLIEQALPELEEQANELLGKLTDYNLNVKLESQREYKDKKRDDKKETLDIIVSDGSGARDYETYSGGEAFRINFALRLALSRVLSHRAGAKLRTLVIDEGFGNQDAQGRQRLIEAINAVKDDFEKILIITHIEELKDYFSNRIEVTKTDSGSSVEVILG